MKFNSLFIGILICISTLLVNAQTDTIPPVRPQNFQGFSYEKHVDIVWKANTEVDLAAYKVYKWNGSTFTFYVQVAEDKNYFTNYFGGMGFGTSYKLSAIDDSGNESELTDSVSVLTRTITDEEFLDMVQRTTFRYFWNYAHPVSGLARERLGSDETVASGGSGFGIMSIPVAVERGFITRDEAVARMLKILDFLNNKADRFHGAFSHWFNGTTGDVIPFSTYDNGGDLVETSFLIQGLLACRQYFNGSDSSEILIRDLITNLWEGVEYSWYRRTQYSNYLYWHWSPNYEWTMNFPLIGPNETMICYLLGIASPTYPIPSNLYYDGWASSSNYDNGNTYYGYKLWVGWNYGGPLFFSHYSFLGFDPRNKKDNFCNYYLNNRNHSLINRAYCIANPYGHNGYNEDSWGLTASDDPFGYSVHEPYNDNGTITPTAALSSMPYTPVESIAVLKNLYRTYGNQIFGEYGFKDAFNIDENWFASSYLAIDQGPIIAMIENYRTELLWNNFMANPEIQPMLDAIGFVADSTTALNDVIPSKNGFQLFGNYPNPFNPSTIISFTLPQNDRVKISIYNSLGEKIRELVEEELPSGLNEKSWDGKDSSGKNVSSGVYLYTIRMKNNFLTGKMILAK